MRLTFHPSVASDVARVMAHYQQVADPSLAEEFYAELRSCFAKAAEHPLRYPIYSGDLRRVTLDRFPYHFLFRIAGGATPPKASNPRHSTAIALCR